MYKTVDTQSIVQQELKYKRLCLVVFCQKYEQQVQRKNNGYSHVDKQAALKLLAQEKKAGTRNQVRAGDIVRETFNTSRPMKFLLGDW